MSENIEIVHEDQDWVEAYKELAVAITDLPEIKWCDLWEEQPYSTSEEYPVPYPAVYLEFNTNEIDETGDGGELDDFNITVHLYYCDIADSYQGSWNQADALSFAALMKAIHRLLQGRKGNHHSRLSRVAMGKEATPHAGGRLHFQTYRCIISDNTAVKKYETDLGEDREVTIGREGRPSSEESNPLYGDLPLA